VSTAITKQCMHEDTEYTYINYILNWTMMHFCYV
jgi:hypothetical protein